VRVHVCAFLSVIVFRQAFRFKSETQARAKAPSVAKNIEELKNFLLEIMLPALDKKWADQNEGHVAALKAVVAAENQRSQAAWESAWSQHRIALEHLMSDKLSTHHDHLIHDLNQNYVEFLEEYKQVMSESESGLTRFRF